MAEQHGIENANRLRKQDLVFAIVRQMMKQGESFTCSGTLEILPDGFGFLRSADTSYLAGPDDIYVSPSQIRRFNLHTGDTIEGSVRVPKDNERYFALVRLDSINCDDPEACKHKILFENLTPLFPTKQFKLERDIKAEENLTSRAIDLVSPIGRGQRQLIIGDRKTGKTAIALDTILNQKAVWDTGDPAQQVRCIYVATGQKGSTIASVRSVLEEHGALEYTTIVASPASDPAGFKYLSPYTGSAIGQHWMYSGKHVLIVFDDLSKQAEAYRAVSLLLRRPPGREAYPGDVFYLHSRLLERCAKLSDDLGAGSMTGLPIIETKANDVSAYIPTNVISITDGQIFLQSDLFNSDQRPAVDVGISVSRVGGAAQVKAMKEVAGTLKITLAQYRSMQAFAMFASDLDAATRQQLTRGERLMELLKQPQFTPYPVEEQVVSVWTGTNGYLDDLDVADVLPFEAALLDHLRRNTEILTTIREAGVLDEEAEASLRRAVESFRSTYSAGDRMLSGEVAAAEDEVPAERTTEQIVLKRG